MTISFINTAQTFAVSVSPICCGRAWQRTGERRVLLCLRVSAPVSTFLTPLTHS
ncbi:hypothetical protein [Candidatus Amarolinea dominans]|uniref:hypothetical protein n=1 Tax=Candidatus Amarolinea dominans TaxID=3140696 RepID=UPI0031376949|nr:hypothetical protein [Anaerolineae bacterium]